MSPMNRIRSLGAIALAFALCLFALGGCESSAPPIPIPPPGFLSAPAVDGYATLSGSGATPEAYIFVLNEDAQTGVIDTVDLNGNYSVRIQASVGNTVSYWFRVGSAESLPQSAVVPP